MMILEVMAVLPLTEKQQHILVEIGSEKVRRNLANSAQTSVNVINTLAQDSDYTTRYYALRYCSDLNLLQNALTGNARKIAAVLRNKNLPGNLGEKFIDHADPEIALAAYLNPNVALSLKQSKLTPFLASKMVTKGSNLGAKVVRAHQLVLTNPYITENLENWDSLIKRSGLGVSSLTKDSLTKLQKCKFKGLTQSKYDTLCFLIENKDKLTINELVTMGNPLADFYAVSDPELTYANAQTILSGERSDAEPHIIAKLVHKFSASVMLGAGLIADSRINAASFLNPEITHYNKIRVLPQDILEITEILEDNLNYWDNFSKLSVHWENDITLLAKAARAL